MNTPLKRVFLFPVHSNLWISLAGPALVQLTSLLLDFQPSWGVIALSFFGTLLSYNFQRWARFPVWNRRFGEHTSPVSIHTYALMILIGAVGSLVSVFFLDPWSWLLLLPVGIISIWYAVPFPGSGKALRDLPFLKIIWIALSWSILTVGLPIVENVGWEGAFDLTGSFVFFERFLFIFAITIPFDIRDLPYDEPEKRTIPQVLGITRSKWTSIFLLLLFVSLVCIRAFLTSSLSMPHFVGLALSWLTTTILVQRAGSHTQEPFYSLLLDGTMIFQYLFVVGAGYFM